MTKGFHHIIPMISSTKSGLRCRCNSALFSLWRIHCSNFMIFFNDVKPTFQNEFLTGQSYHKFCDQPFTFPDFTDKHSLHSDMVDILFGFLKA